MAYDEGIRLYFDRLVQVLKNLDIGQINKFFEVLRKANNDGKTIYVFGNGGAGATASHMVCDFNKGLSYGKNKRFKFICLNDNIPIMLAYANDVSYEDIFVEQLKNFLTKGDIVIGISGSGNSENVIRAIDYANGVGALTVGLCGYSGGRLKKKAKMFVHIDINDMQIAEDIFMMLTHVAYQVLGKEN